jgi:hypothetical protein
MKKRCYLVFIPLLVLVQACDEIISPQEEGLPYTLEGNAQKGPFINGSNVNIIELDKQFAQTGKSFTATTGAYGQFGFDDISLKSQYIEVKADGFYYNEMSGNLSNSRLTLNAIADLSDNETINVNVLTHLEFERVKYLISELDLSIQEAKEQARNEIMDIFNLGEFSYEQSEKLNILGVEEGDGILLAISAILQGNNSTAGLSLVLADIVSDIKTDGVLDDSSILTNLKRQASAINADKIAQDLIQHCNEMGLDINETAQFKEYIDLFKGDDDSVFVSPFTIPPTGDYGINLLDPLQTEIEIGTEYSLAMDIPETGSVTIKIRKVLGGGVWYYQPFKVLGWQVSQFANNEQLFTSTMNSITADMPIEFHNDGKAIIEYYYNESTTPMGTKEIYWGEAPDTTGFVIPRESTLGVNLLNFTDTLLGDTTVTFALQKEGDWDVNFNLHYYGEVNAEILDEYGTCYYPQTNNPAEIKLSGKNEGDNISEVQVRFTGSGSVYIYSPDLKIEDLNGYYRNFEKFFYFNYQY